MELIEGIKGRRSIRKFKSDAVSHEVMDKIIEAARFAPTWKNTQTPRYVVVEDREILSKIAGEATLGFEHNKDIIEGAPALVIITSINKRSGYERDGSFSTSKGNEWQMFDAGIAAEAFCLSAYNEGVGSVILGIFDDAKVAEIIGLGEDRTVSCLIPVGYPDEAPNPVPRKDLSEYVTYK
jgi:nitroreductase